MIRYKFCLFGLLGLLSSIISGCSVYQKHFGSTGHDYSGAQTAKPLKTTKNEYPLNKSNRYSIPKIPGQWTKPVTDFTPPDYANKEVENKAK
jgi:uncharacterized lipoprotein